MMKPIPNKAKDMHYYKSLFDRYFGPNHVLAKESSLMRLQRSMTAPNVYQHRFIDQQFPHIHFSRSIMSTPPGAPNQEPLSLPSPMGPAAVPLQQQQHFLPHQQGDQRIDDKVRTLRKNYKNFVLTATACNININALRSKPFY